METPFYSYKEGCAGILLKDGFVLLDQTSLSPRARLRTMSKFTSPKTRPLVGAGCRPDNGPFGDNDCIEMAENF